MRLTTSYMIALCTIALPAHAATDDFCKVILALGADAKNDFANFRGTAIGPPTTNSAGWITTPLAATRTLPGASSCVVNLITHPVHQKLGGYDYVCDFPPESTKVETMNRITTPLLNCPGIGEVQLGAFIEDTIDDTASVVFSGPDFRAGFFADRGQKNVRVTLSKL